MERIGGTHSNVWTGNNGGWREKKKKKEKKRGLETVQNRAARRGLGANRHVATEALRGVMGWSTFQERINKTKIN